MLALYYSVSPQNPINRDSEAERFLYEDDQEEITGYLRRARPSGGSSSHSQDGLSQFSREAAKYPQLGEEDQVKLVGLYQNSLLVKKQLDGRMVQAKDLHKARTRVRQGEEAITYLTRSNFRLNLRIVGELVTKMRGDLDRSRSQEIRMELFSEGNGAIVKAAQEYDVKHGTNWTTFMARKIRDAVRMGLAADNPMAMPASAQRLLRLINPTRGDLLSDLGREATRDELVQALFDKSLAWALDHLSDEEKLLGPAQQHEAALRKMKKQGMAKAIREIADILPWLPGLKSLDAPAGGEGRSSLGEVAVASPVSGGSEGDGLGIFGSQVEVDQASSDIQLSLSVLPDRDADIIRMRFTLPPYETGKPNEDGSLGSGKPYTHKDIAAKYNVTPERIRQLENAALAKLATPHAHYASLASHMGVSIGEPGGKDTKSLVNRKIGRGKENS